MFNDKGLGKAMAHSRLDDNIDNLKALIENLDKRLTSLENKVQYAKEYRDWVERDWYG